ncbi:helix-turn-helix domain-containing protein [Moraxella bovis]|uniref:YdaS family helix-turn-helix protein n=1 Tax=Moraxella bovis TaxID=476 RepID=UPI00099459EF|nr:YdaS family helix-turn-helix protein [Moraxella bovis]OOR91694.1 hypothetical protein B0182_02485 [Moraxella bovis]UZA15748.1 helix-turn-helix domain-containing protein [Moraxella bovis]UZA17737.1 helix-turn-helix domain-containing protein [Moraxella bovis]
MTDKELIEKLGDTTALAKLLGFTEQRVSNWKRRGIPPKVKLENPELFQSTTQTKTPSDN